MVRMSVEEAVMSIARLTGLISELFSIVAALDADTIEPGDASALVSVFVRGENLCAAGKAMCASRAAEAGAHRRAGHVDPASWLAELSGEPRGRANDALQTASSLSRLPLLGAALRTGELSPTKARAVVDAASQDPASEASLLETARTGSLHELRDHAERVKAAARSKEDDEARYEAIRKARHLRTFTGSDGGLKGQFSLTPDAGAKVLSILQPASDFFFDEARREGRRESSEAYLADALVAVVTGEWPGAEADYEEADVGEGEGGAGGEGGEGGEGGAGGEGDSGDYDGTDMLDPSDLTDLGDTVERSDHTDVAPAESGRAVSPSNSSPSRPAAADNRVRADGYPDNSKKRRRGTPPRAVVICRVDLSALQRGEVMSGEMCEIPGVGPVPVSVVRELFGDCFLKFIITKGVDIQSVVHYGRYPRAHQRTALQFRDPCCVVPGCGRTFGLQYDHTDPFGQGGPTSLDNLARLCTPHHAMKTHRGYQIRGGPGHWEWVAPSGAGSGAGDGPAGRGGPGSAGIALPRTTEDDRRDWRRLE
jgi:hypothetical protein